MGSYLLAVLIGIGVGIIVGMLGAGGGVLSVPILVYLLGQSPHQAAAGSLVIVTCTAVFGIIHHIRHRRVAWRQGTIFGLLSVFAAVLGSRVSILVPDDLLLSMLAALLAAVSIAMFRRAYQGKRQAVQVVAAGQASQDNSDEIVSTEQAGDEKPDWLKIIACASLTGLLTGFFGVGGGFMIVPVLIFALKMPIRLATGTSMLVMIISSVASLISRIGADFTMDWPVILLFTLGSSIGGLLGGPISTKAKPHQLTFIFALLLLGIAVFTFAELGLG